MSLKIICYNTDSRVANLLKLKDVIDNHDPIVCLLQDIPKLSRDFILNTFRSVATDYSVIFDEESLTRYRKLDNLLLVDKERINVRAVYMNETRSKATALGILIGCIEDDGASNNEDRDYHGRLLLFSIYIRPRATSEETKNCLDWIESVSKETDGNSRTIIMGDFNASDTLWSPLDEIFNNKEHSSRHYRQTKLTRGRQVANHMSRMNLVCLNHVSQGPTFSTPRNSAYIDLSFVGSKAMRTWNTLSLITSWEESSHKVLILANNKRSCQDEYRQRRKHKRILVELIKPEYFDGLHILCDGLCINWKQLPRERIISRMETMSKRLAATLESVQEKITVVRVRRGRRNSSTTSTFNSRIRCRINKLHEYESRRARLISRIRRRTDQGTASSQRLMEMFNTRRYGRNTNNEENSSGEPPSIDDRALNRLRAKIRRLRKNIMDGMRASRLPSIYDNAGEANLWHRFNLIDTDGDFQRRESVIVTDGLSSQEDIDRLADEKFPFKNRVNINYVKLANQNRKNSTITKIIEHEVVDAINSLKSKKYTSSSGIRMDVFHGSIKFIINIIKTLTEMSFWACYIPSNSKITSGSLIPKKVPGQYRVVHVSSPLAALFELIALNRLEYRLEVSKLNSPYQFGFTTLVSRHDLVSRIVEFFYKELIHVGYMAAGVIISLDIEGAFDNVNQDLLIDKMDRDMGEDSIKYWLAEFILNRQISIKSGTLRSKTKNVCMGVPQGSALGPILWNYIISDIDSDIARPGELELVRYADDILLIYSGSDRKYVQTIIDTLVDKLKRLDLRVRPEKCSIMGLRLGIVDQRVNRYYIDGQAIKRVKNMNILGVPVTRKLRLLRNSEEHKRKLLINIKRLNNAQKFGIINNAKEWRMLIDGLIHSLLVYNNWPVLVIDRMACKWVDNMLIRSLRLIFDWPANVSVKLIRLITGSIECYETARTITKYRQLVVYPGIYDFLLKLDANEAIQTAQLTFEAGLDERRAELPKINISTEIGSHRRHFDPTKWPNIGCSHSFYGGMADTDYTWIILDRGLGSMMAEINNQNQVAQVRLGKHLVYSISYFNSFALLLKTVSDRTINNRSVTISETNSILMAIENSHNRDWRVIQLRERIFDNGWRIRKISLAEERSVRSKMALEYKRLNLRFDNSAIISDFRLWLMANEGLLHNMGTTNSVTRVQHRVDSLEEPDLFDYKRRNQLNRWIPREVNRYFLQSHTTISRTLSTQVETWQNITPNWLDGFKMLVLSGMINNENGTLQHTSDLVPVNCQYCRDNDADVDDTDIPSNWHGLDSMRIEQCIVLHKMFLCKKFINERRMFLSQISHLLERSNATGNRYIMDRILADRIACQRFLRYMVRCCMND